MSAKYLTLFRSLVCLLVGSMGADASTKIRLQLDWYPDAERGGYVCALTNGLYEQAGLDVQIIPAGTGNPMGTALMSGQTDFALAESGDVLVARSHGIPLTCVMATMQHNPLGIMVHDASPVRSFADLEGKSVGVAPGASWFLYLAKKFQLKNVREQRLTLSVGNFLVNPNLIQQAFVTSEPYVCEKNNVKVRMLLVRDSGFDPYRVVVTSEKFLKANPEAVRAFVKASIKGWNLYLADTPEAKKTDAAILKLNPNMTQDHTDFSRKALIDGGFVTGFPDKGEAMGKLDPKRFSDLAEILEGLNLLPKDVDVNSSFTTEYCNEATP